MLSELALALLLMVTAADAPSGALDLPFAVIVHRSNPRTSIARAELSAIYMKRTRSWRGGAQILPIDHLARTRIREDFSRTIHGKSVAYVTRYWQRVIFAGRGIPPPELKSDAAVVDFVKNNRGAIGYVDRGTAVADVKVLPVTR